MAKSEAIRKLDANYSHLRWAWNRGVPVLYIAERFGVSTGAVVDRLKGLQLYERIPPKKHHGHHATDRAGKSLLVARVCWETCCGVIPEGFVIHHIDSNTFNQELDNLVYLSHVAHSRLHGHGWDWYRNNQRDPKVEPLSLKRTSNPADDAKSMESE